MNDIRSRRPSKAVGKTRNAAMKGARLVGLSILQLMAIWCAIPVARVPALDVTPDGTQRRPTPKCKRPERLKAFIRSRIRRAKTISENIASFAQAARFQ